MMAEYRFLRKHGGFFFAKVAVESTLDASWSTSLAPTVKDLPPGYGQALLRGLSLAVAEQSRRKGPSYQVVVTNLLESAADTTPEVVECTAAVAAWKSFGNREEEVEIAFEDGRWKASFL